MKPLTVQKNGALNTQTVSTLARELGAAYRSHVEHYRRKLGLSNQDAATKAEDPSQQEYLQSVMSGPADQVRWDDLEELMRSDPELALRRWHDVKREALDELRSGDRGSRVVEGYFSDAWQRAQFLAIRRELAEDWRPRHGIERQLIDMMVQAQTQMFFWQQQLVLRASVEPMRQKNDIEKHGKLNPPRVSEHDAIEQAAAMADRFNRMFLRTLRALRDLRRYAPTIVVQNAEQVNVGGQQVNLARGKSFARASFGAIDSSEESTYFGASCPGSRTSLTSVTGKSACADPPSVFFLYYQH